MTNEFLNATKYNYYNIGSFRKIAGKEFSLPNSAQKRSAPRIATSGRGSTFRSMLRVLFSYSQPIRFVRLDPKHAQSDGKFVNCRLPVLDIPRGRNSWC